MNTVRMGFLFGLSCLLSGRWIEAQDWIDAPRVLLEGNASEIACVGDVDGDGDVDLLVVDRGSSGVTGFRVLDNAGGEFSAGATIPVAPFASGFVGSLVQLTDFTGDGQPDVVLDTHDYGTGSNGLRLFPGTAGTFGAPLDIPTSGSALGGTAADREGDGVFELALLLSFPSSSCTVGWWHWNGTTLVPDPPSTVGFGYGPVGVADLTGDGWLDIVVPGGDTYDLECLATVSGGSLSLHQALSLDSTSLFRKAHPSDLDGDGDVDLLVAWTEGYALHSVVVENVGGALVAAPRQTFPAPIGASDGRGFLVDWDQDGDPDFVCPCWTSVLFLENRGGRFSLADEVPIARGSIGGSPTYGSRDGGVADLNGDGRLDFAGGRVVYLGSGGFSGSWSVYPLSDGHLRDMDGDRDLDLVDYYSPWTNDASGSLTRGAWTLPPAPPGTFYRADIIHLDLDGDGRGDLLKQLRRDQYPSFPLIEMRLLRGTATGGFVDARAAGAPGVPIEPANRRFPGFDLDQDGDMDLLGATGWWENDGAGYFATFHAAWTGLPLTAMDVDGDSDPDLLTRTGSTHLYLQRNTAGTFVAELLVAEAYTSYSREPALGDLDGDGDPELAVGSTAGSAHVLVFENLGGTFAPPLSLPGRDHAHDVLVLDDVDGDGKLDVIGAPAPLNAQTGGSWLVWRHGAGALEFEAPSTYFGWPAYSGGDVDSDGDADVLARRIVRNRRFEGAPDGRIRQFGAGATAGGVARPLLGATGPLRPGSTTASLVLRRGPGAAPGVLFVGTGPASRIGLVPNLPWLLESPWTPALPFVLGGTPGATAEGGFTFPLGPATTALAGRTLWLQAVLYDAAGTRRVAVTNGLELTFGL
ncbi:MAG TPA: VCBS repeat-containing protein [Planctomycetota bacterium]